MEEKEFIEEIKRKFPEAEIETIEDALDHIVGTEYEHIYSEEFEKFNVEDFDFIPHWKQHDLMKDFLYNHAEPEAFKAYLKRRNITIG